MAFAPSFSDISTQAASMNINSSNLFAVKGKYTLLLSLIPCDFFIYFFLISIKCLLALMAHSFTSLLVQQKVILSTACLPTIMITLNAIVWFGCSQIKPALLPFLSKGYRSNNQSGPLMSTLRSSLHASIADKNKIIALHRNLFLIWC